MVLLPDYFKSDPLLPQVPWATQAHDPREWGIKTQTQSGTNLPGFWPEQQNQHGGQPVVCVVNFVPRPAAPQWPVQQAGGGGRGQRGGHHWPGNAESAVTAGHLVSCRWSETGRLPRRCSPALAGFFLRSPSPAPAPNPSCPGMLPRVLSHDGADLPPGHPGLSDWWQGLESLLLPGISTNTDSPVAATSSSLTKCLPFSAEHDHDGPQQEGAAYS